MASDAAQQEGLLLETFVELADTLVADFDVVDLLDVLARRCVRLFSVRAAGVVLADQRGYLRVMACSTEQPWLTDLLQTQNRDGPLLDSYRGGERVNEPDLEAARARWPSFAPLAIDAGVRSVYALPLHLRNALLGSLGLFGAETATLTPDDARRARALADVASISLVHVKIAEGHDALTLRVSTAMQNRTIVEQAQGMLAELHHVDLDEAFTLLRRHAQAHGQRLTEVALAVASGCLALPRQAQEKRSEADG